MIACWSVKGGVGTTVTATVLALELARLQQTVIADGGGDVPSVLGISLGLDKPGLRQWMAADQSVSAEAVHRLETAATPDLSVIPEGPPSPGGCSHRSQAERLEEEYPGAALVVDAGNGADSSSSALAAAAETSLLVMRSCFLAVRRASESELRADGLVLIEEAGRSLSGKDIEDVLQVPVLAAVGWDAAVSRLVDAGRTKSRLPRSLRPLRTLAESLAAGALRASA